MSEGGGRKSYLLVYALVALVAVVGLLVFAYRRDRTIPLGTPVRFDDFSFAVVDTRRLDAIDELRPGLGAFLVVRLGIRNQAKRVDYQFRAAETLVEGDDGRRYPIDLSATRKLSSSPTGLPGCDGPVPAGQSCTTELVFDVPKDVRSPRLRLTSGPIVDVLDGLFEGGRAGFALGSEK